MPVGDELLAALVALAIDLTALVTLMAVLARRHGGRSSDVITACVTFNIGLFCVAQVLASVELGVGAGFGLFAVLSIIRLRSDLFTNSQLAYVFAALALALVTGFPGVPLPLAGALGAVLVITVVVLEALRGRAPQAETCVVTLDTVRTDPAALVADLERRLGLSVVSVRLLEVDAVRETTTVQVRHVARVLARPALRVQA